MVERIGEGHFNYVDRVRLREPHSFSGPGRGSGWRQRSFSSIDLSTSSGRSRDYGGFYDLYTRVDTGRDYEDFYAVNHKARKGDSIYDHVDPLFNAGGVEACSLRRTRSLAVIREETFNDLQISGVRTRRSQLIPRAKLVDRNFFQERYKAKKEEDDAASAKTHTSQESDEFYANLKRLDASTQPASSTWQNEKSDLDSLDSSYFKNSSHQASLELNRDQCGDGKHVEAEIDIHCADSRILADTTTSNSDSVDHCPEVGEKTSLPEIQLLDEILQTEDQKIASQNNTLKWLKANEREQGEEFQSDQVPEERSKLIIELNSDTTKFRDDLKSVVSYDSIYLSSETSDRQTVINESLCDPLPEVTISSGDGTIHITVDDYDEVLGRNQYVDPRIADDLDTLYSQVNKSKPKIVGIEPKASVTNLTTFSDISNRGTLERLTLLTTNRLLNDAKANRDLQGKLVENHYCSLPDINIGKCLRASERIDAKLRLSCDIEEEKTIYDSISHFGRAHKRLRQRENCEVVVLNPISIEEQPREAPSIEVETPIKQVEDSDSTNEYLSQLGLDIETQQNSLDTFSAASDQECSIGFSQQTAYAVNIGGKKVIVDEVDKLHLQEAEDRLQDRSVKRSNSLRDSEVLKGSIEERNSEIKIFITDTSGETKDEGGNCCNFTPPSPPSPVKELPEETQSCDVEDNQATPQEAPENSPEEEVFNARPIKVVDEVKSLNDRSSQSAKEDCLKSKVLNGKRHVDMPRPQILHIVEPTKKSKPSVSFNLQPPKVDPPPPPPPEPNPDEIQQEFHDKVDSIRCYWSKLATSSESDEQPDNEAQAKDSQNDVAPLTSVENIVKTIEGDVGDKKVFNSGKFNGEKSFCPTVEIIELDGKTQTAVVKAKSAENDFDHVRYKVMKSDTFQKNLLTQSRREAQFDGLMQYLQDYSFQELLANNNVVIIEPVRTKIEKISDKPVKHHRPACRITGGAGKGNEKGKNGLKRHFFYHPVRVNKELIDEELPTPDTVRNVRKLFEGTLRMRKEHPAAGMKASPAIGAKHTDCLRKKTLRYLAIDTSYDDAAGSIRKWDSASLSSGISSGDLSSPCECTATTEHGDTLFTADGHKVIHYSSEENLCDDELCDTHYVSQDVLEKIRERGSSVTYYGGRVVDKKSNISPMTKAIMQEIRGSQIKCGACQPHNCPQTEELTAKFQRSDNNYLGVKFKLVKSNSCSSRLELVGTGKLNSTCAPNKIASVEQEKIQENGSEEHSLDAETEQSVRTIVERLETGAIHQKPVPRIIESKCIEKIGNDDAKGGTGDGTTMTINNQLTEGGKSTEHRSLGPVELITQVTVNNHISFCSPPAAPPAIQAAPHAARETTKSTKVCRNKNVDLAFSMSSTQKSQPTPKPTKDKENNAKKASQSLENLVNGRNEQTFRDIKGNSCESTKAKIIYHQQKSNSIDSDGGPQRNPKVVMRRFSDHILYDSQKNTPQSQPPDVSTTPPTQSLGNIQQAPMQNKMVKWGTLNKFDEKNYVTNDTKLKHKKKYDEMEFEEFEVLDPNGECYDSLNSCK